jgi:hypothetical protein
MAAPMFERIVALGGVCAACRDAGRRFAGVGLPVNKRYVGSEDGGRLLAQICLICDQFPPAPHTTRSSL